MSFMGAPSSGSNTPGFQGNDNQGHHLGHASSMSLSSTGNQSAFNNPQADTSFGSSSSDEPLVKRDGTARRGICKFFNSQKGFGFVLDNNAEELGGQEVFVHFTAIQSKTGFRSLAEGEEVEYEITHGPKGFQASRLTGPGGRPVVGDPKARLVKQPQFMQAVPIAFPGPYGMDPYIQQHPGAVYVASPYTSHALYAVHPGQQGQYQMAGNPQYSPQVSGAGYSGNNRNIMMGSGQPGMAQGGFASSPSGNFGPVGGLASAMNNYSHVGPQSPFTSTPASTYSGGAATSLGGGGASRYSTALSGGGPASTFTGMTRGQDDGFSGFNTSNPSGGADNAQDQPPTSSAAAYFGSGNLLYSTN